MAKKMTAGEDATERNKRDTFIRMAGDGLMRVVGFANEDFCREFEERLADPDFVHDLAARVDTTELHHVATGAANLVRLLTKMQRVRAAIAETAREVAHNDDPRPVAK